MPKNTPSKKTATSRRERDVRRGQYEFPAFSAGTVKVLLEKALWNVQMHSKRYGMTVLLETALEQLREAQQEIVVWQRLAAMITDYDAARELVESEVRE